MIVHAFYHLEDRHIPFLDHFPGVPAFFFVSGFLIYASYRQSGSVLKYWTNRLLRLLPALVVVTLGALVVVLTAKGLAHAGAHFPTYLRWFVAQISLGQAYTPGIFRDIGVGALNGALWTITVELLFYISVPIIVALERYFRHIVWLLLIISFGIYAQSHLYDDIEIGGRSLEEYLRLTPVYWGWMFMVGILTFKHFALLYRVRRYFVVGALLIVLLILIDLPGSLFNSHGNRLGLVYFLAYVALIFWAGFATPYTILRPDFSYGLYIWHMVVINALLVIGSDAVWQAVVFSALAAIASWYLVEKPSLSLKRYSLRSGQKPES